MTDADWRLRTGCRTTSCHGSMASSPSIPARRAHIARRWGPRIPVLLSGYSIDTDFYHPRYNEPPEHIVAVGDDAERDFPTLLAAMEGVAGELVIRTRQT